MKLTDQENIPLSGQMGGQDDSPYLRRQRTMSVRRGRVSHRLRRIFGCLIALVALGLAGYLLASYALSSPRFVLNSTEDVVVIGNHFVSREEVLNALGLSPGKAQRLGVNIFRLSLEARRKQVESIPWVRAAALTRAYPHRLVAHLVERTPVAFASIDGRVCLVDSEGDLLAKPENASFDFPVLTGLEAAGSLDERRSRVALYREFMQSLGEEVPRSGWMISEVDVADADDLKALLVQGRETLQVHFGHTDFLERFRSFLMLLPEIRKSNTKLDSVDLRYRNQVVVDPRSPVPPRGPAPQAGPEH